MLARRARLHNSPKRFLVSSQDSPTCRFFASTKSLRQLATASFLSYFTAENPKRADQNRRIAIAAGI